jgi:hypothetical protein
MPSRLRHGTELSSQVSSLSVHSAGALRTRFSAEQLDHIVNYA